MKIIRRTLTALMLYFLQGCGTTVPPVQGTVTDMVTGQPIVDVDVVVLYFGQSSELQRLVNGPFRLYQPGCGASRITKTDANGRWQVEGFRLGVNAENLRYSLLLYKDGYREGSPGSDPNTTIEMKLTADKDVYEYDDSYPYPKKRDYTQVRNQTIEHYKKWYLNPYYYIGNAILGSDNRHQYLFRGCGEQGKDDPGLNLFAQKFILKWIDTVPDYYKEANSRGIDTACLTVKGYAKDHPEFRPVLFSSEQRSENLKWLCPNEWDAIKTMDSQDVPE